MKGVILSITPHATLIDLTHEIEPQNVLQAAFLLEASYPYFPEGSVFVNVVDPGVGSKRRILALKTSRGIFLAPDNGLLARILDRERHLELRSVTNSEFFLKKVSRTFHGRDCFAPTAARLAKNPGKFREVGPLVRDYVRLDFPPPKVRGGKIAGEIIFMDHFGNAFTNLSREFLRNEGVTSRFRVRVGKKEVGPIRGSYHEVEKGQALALFNASDILEIAVNQGSAREKLGLRQGITVEIRKS